MKTISVQHTGRGRVTGGLALVLVALLITSCATQGDTARTEGTLVGAGAGAAVGAGLGYLLGGSRGALIGAGVGAVAGGTGGYVYGDRVARRHEALRGKENDLDARIAFAQGVNADTRQYNQRLRQEVADLEPKIANLEARMRAQQVTQQELTDTRQALSARVNDARRQLQIAEGELQDLRNFKARQNTSSPALDQEIALLEATLTDIRSQTSTMASQSARI
jgi:hypothetical protein